GRKVGMMLLSLRGQRTLAKLQSAEGGARPAFAPLADAQQRAARLGNVRAERALIAVTADLHLRQGNAAAAANLLETGAAPQVLREHEKLTRIRLLLAQNQTEAAQSK